MSFFYENHQIAALSGKKFVEGSPLGEDDGKFGKEEPADKNSDAGRGEESNLNTNGTKSSSEECEVPDL